MVDCVSVRFKKARVEKSPLNIRIQWNAGTACVSECVLKTLACRGLRVGPSKKMTNRPHFAHIQGGFHTPVRGIMFVRFAMWSCDSELPPGAGMRLGNFRKQNVASFRLGLDAPF